ncbi:MAG: Gfo/Idh/MocA family protein [Anaerolineae bacterium]|jgi:UDP-N-acetyl-2-amino-2-deoxyglucuronate dehydrogenase
MAEREIGFAVVGLGMGAGHARDIYDLPGARLVAVCDIDEERLNAVGDRFGAKKYTDFDTMLRDPEIEVVSIALPSGMHAEFGIRAVEAGKHVVVEKPIDINLQAIDRLIEAADKAGVKLAGVFQSRYHPLYQRLKELLDSGRMGKLYGIHADLFWWREQSYYEDEKHGKWKGTWAMDGGGSLANQGIHTLDLVQWLAGPVRSVFGYMGHYAHDIEGEDKLSAVIQFENGAIGTINTTTAAWPGGGDTLTIHGENGTIATGKKRTTIEVWKLRDDPDGKEEQEMKAMYPPESQAGAPTASDPRATALHGHQPIFADMIEAIREDRDPFITGRSARKPVEIMLAIYESARTHKEVKLPL